MASLRNVPSIAEVIRGRSTRKKTAGKSPAVRYLRRCRKPYFAFCASMFTLMVTLSPTRKPPASRALFQLMP